MSVSKRIVLAVSASWLSRVITILANLTLMPILFRHMDKEELGLWFLLSNSQAFLDLLSLGIAPILTRYIALAKGRSGASLDVVLSDTSQQQIQDLLVTGRVLLQSLSVITFFISSILGCLFVKKLDLHSISQQAILFSWILMCAGYAFNIWIAHLSCYLEGMGQVGWQTFIVTLITLLNILLNIGAILLGGGILALAVISVITGLLQRIAIISIIKRFNLTPTREGQWNFNLAFKLVKQSLLFWLTSLGMFLILKTDQYFITFTSGTDNIPTYNAAYQLVSNLRNLALPFTLASSTFISQMWEAGKLEIAQQMIIRNCRIGLLIMICGSSFLITVGKEVTDLWLGEGIFIGYSILITFCIMFTLELQHVSLMYGARATGHEGYAIASLTAGVLNIIFTMILVKPLGLWGIALGTLIAQALTINWYAVLRPLKELKISFNLYLAKVSYPLLVVISINTLLCLCLKTILSSNEFSHPIIAILGTSLIYIFIFISAVWLLILENHEKERVTLWLKRIV